MSCILRVFYSVGLDVVWGVPDTVSATIDCVVGANAVHVQVNALNMTG